LAGVVVVALAGVVVVALAGVVVVVLDPITAPLAALCTPTCR
jgi:hypothetical protein